MKHNQKFVVLLFLLLCCVALSACQDSTEQPQEGRGRFTLIFSAGPGGWISGEETQTLMQGDNAKEVIAIAHEGYYFAGWTDTELYEDETIVRGARTVENVQSSALYQAVFRKKTYFITYRAEQNGRIFGKQEQAIPYRENAEEVTAVPEEGYVFSGWSDGNTSASRRDLGIQEDVELTAYFQKLERTFTYDDWDATGSETERKITLTYLELDRAEFYIPQREHFSFSGWYLNDLQVTDCQGNLVVGNELFDSMQTELHAKWSANESFLYKILLVYVDEVHARLKNPAGETVNVFYKMSTLERRICQSITVHLRDSLNRMLDGLVKFEIDEYFTTVPVTEKDLRITGDAQGNTYYTLPGEALSEIDGKKDNYSSVITTFSMNDFNQQFHNSAGAAHAKFATVHLESCFLSLIVNEEPLENLLDDNCFRWDDCIDTYIHEIAHTIEMRLNMESYHRVLSYNAKRGRWGIGVNKLYYLNLATVEGERAGIPYEFWKGDIAELQYDFGEGGWVNWAIRQSVLFGHDAIAVTAIALPGYEFIGWSDGVLTETRADKNVKSDLHVTALFRKKEE